MSRLTRAAALAAAALALTATACATRQTTTDSQTTSPVARPGPAGPSAPRDVSRPPDAATQPGASLTLTGPGGAVALSDIFFAFDESTLSGEAQRVLSGNAEYLRRSPAVRIEIEGHADERGSTAYNLALGDRRATAAKRYLESLGIDSSRISTISFGEERPFVQGTSEDAWAQNRRGHFVEVR